MINVIARPAKGSDATVVNEMARNAGSLVVTLRGNAEPGGSVIIYKNVDGAKTIAAVIRSDESGLWTVANLQLRLISGSPDPDPQKAYNFEFSVEPAFVTSEIVNGATIARFLSKNKLVSGAGAFTVTSGDLNRIEIAGVGAGQIVEGGTLVLRGVTAPFALVDVYQSIDGGAEILIATVTSDGEGNWETPVAL